MNLSLSTTQTPSKHHQTTTKLPTFSLPASRIPKQGELRFESNRRIVGSKNSWNRNENQLYVSFLRRNFDLVERPVEDKRIIKIYCQMEQYICTKNYAQCRIHHRRMLQKYTSTESIIQNVERRLRGCTSKMEQYKGLQVELEEEQYSTIHQQQLWAFLEEDCWTNEQHHKNNIQYN